MALTLRALSSDDIDEAVVMLSASEDHDQDFDENMNAWILDGTFAVG